ncbi:MAG: CDP-alcohol phosphatidyltransferase family protein [Deltaproteobacteria bacterium]|nr:MAG: CDP-alcohol phosphatidyltransferase family protein [Deltaproteobacteria bacterium]TMQ18107.1 MAG: CDP-alcohol phosphatidyltransferase family protein [Deltaproteobacteria bacterium]
MRPDVYFCYVTGALWAVALTLYGLRLAARGAFHSDRVSKIGGTALVGRGIMDATYWAIEPVVRGLAALGVTPNGLTWSALVLGLGAGVALALGWFGLATLLATMSTIGDILDGQVARLTNSGSDRGELLDAAVDRYTEFAFLAGLVIVLRTSWWQMALALGATLASFMVSYTSAKAEALQVSPPRGLMRRHERSTYLIAGIGLTPLVGPALVAHDLPYVTPCLVALGVVCVIGNVAAVLRLVRIGRALR